MTKMFCDSLKKKNNLRAGGAGFTLIEVIITISLLLGIMLGVSTMMKGSFEMRIGLAEKNRGTHRLNIIMEKIYHDLAHAFIISKRDNDKTGEKQNGETLFYIKSGFDSDEIAFTTLAADKQRAEIGSEVGFVYYVLKPSKQNPNLKNLYRGAIGRLPEKTDDRPELNIFATNIKSIKFVPFNGEDWAKTFRDWDSTKGDTRDNIPHLVKIELEVFDEIMNQDESEEIGEPSTDHIETIVHIGMAYNFMPLKKPSGSLKWVF